MLIVRMFVNAEEIGHMSMLNTGKKTDDGAAVYSVQQTRHDASKQLETNGPPVTVEHYRDDGPWVLVARAVEAIREAREVQGE